MPEYIWRLKLKWHYRKISHCNSFVRQQHQLFFINFLQNSPFLTLITMIKRKPSLFHTWKVSHCIPWPQKRAFWHQFCNCRWNSQYMGTIRVSCGHFENLHTLCKWGTISLVSLDKIISMALIKVLPWQRGHLLHNLKFKVP